MFLALKHLSFIFLSAVILPITAFCCLCSCKERRKLYTIKDIKQMHIKLSHWLLLLTSGFITSTKIEHKKQAKHASICKSILLELVSAFNFSSSQSVAFRAASGRKKYTIPRLLFNFSQQIGNVKRKVLILWWVILLQRLHYQFVLA